MTFHDIFPQIVKIHDLFETIQVSNSDTGLFRFIHDCGHPVSNAFSSYTFVRKSFKAGAKALVIQMHFQMRFHLKKQKYCYVFTSCPHGENEYDHENTYI